VKQFKRVCLWVAVLAGGWLSVPAYSDPLEPQLFLDCEHLLPTDISIARPNDLPRILQKTQTIAFKRWVKSVQRAEVSELPEVKRRRLTDRRNTWIAPFGSVDAETPSYRAILDRNRKVIVKIVDPGQRGYDWVNEARNSLILASLRLTPFFYGSFEARGGKRHMVYHAPSARKLDYGLKWLRKRRVDRQTSEGGGVPVLFPFTPQHTENITLLGEVLSAIGYRSLAGHDLRVRQDGSVLLTDLSNLSMDPSQPDSVSASLAGDAQEIERLLAE
jgi:hypothetical protein